MFRTELNITPAERPISYSDRILTIGSCFSECIGSFLSSYKFQALPNPFGTVFNPLSINNLLRRGLHNEQVNIDELREYREIWSHYDFHSSFSGTDRNSVVRQINDRIAEVHDFLKSSDLILITLGTAGVYKSAGTDRLVSNCHKHPADWFTRELLSAEEIVSDFLELAGQLPGKRFILTVSPVRHIRDTLPVNSLSKAILRVACHKICDKVAEAEYFPSFEIMNDDLRDYRFYSDDLIHPNHTAETYIWEKFSSRYFDEETRKTADQIAHINRRMGHRPSFPETATHRKFLQQLLADMKELTGNIDFRDEISKITSQLEETS